MTASAKPAEKPQRHRSGWPEEPYPRTAYAWYVVGVLTFVYMFSFIDRQILNLLVRPIERDLGIGDTSMGLLSGLAFAVFYTLFGIPLGRLADSRSRRGIIAIGFAFWSLFTAGCGLARNFIQLMLMRVGVGIGEAALSPAAYSLITDYFPPKRRATAISLYSMATYVGSGLALIIGGLVARFATAQEAWNLPVVGETRPWQVVFFIVGLPGALLALLMYTVREPVRRDARSGKATQGKAAVEPTPLREVIAYLNANRVTFLCHNLGFALLTFSAYGTGAWIPTMFVRKYHWTEATIGQVYGLIAAVASLGVVAGGRLADWMAERGYRDATMRVGLLVSVAWLPFGVLYPLMPDARWAIALLTFAALLASAGFGVAPAAIQQMMPNSMRGQASAIYLFVINLIGMGLGPLAVGMITDYIFRDKQMVNYSLLIVASLAHVLSAVLLWKGMKPFLKSLDRLREWTAGQA